MVWLLALLLGCPDGGGDVDDSDVDGEGCPDDMVPASEAGLLITTFSVNGLAQQAAFEADARVLDRPTACIATDGRTADLIFEVADEPFGRILLGADRTEDHDLNGTDGRLQIEIFDVNTFEKGDWQSGTWWVESTVPLDSDVTGTAVRDGDELQIRFTLQARR